MFKGQLYRVCKIIFCIKSVGRIWVKLIVDILTIAQDLIFEANRNVEVNPRGWFESPPPQKRERKVVYL